MFSSKPKIVSAVQYFTIIFSIIGFFTFSFTYSNLLLLLVFYFLYSGVGVSMVMHRYYTHKTFEFSNPIVKWICVWFAVTAGRGSPLGWVYVHRLHHRYSDQPEDPHYSSLNFKTMWFPSYDKFIKNVNLRLIKDLLNKENIFIDKYYMLFLIVWAGVLLLIDPAIFYFAWALPVALTHFAFNTFLYAGHKHGYKNHETRDSSKNSWLYAILLWGEGWHNNHHKNPGKYNLRENWWEIDVIGTLIGVIKK